MAVVASGATRRTSAPAARTQALQRAGAIEAARPDEQLEIVVAKGTAPARSARGPADRGLAAPSLAKAIG
jgi:hypothetical protein